VDKQITSCSTPFFYYCFTSQTTYKINKQDLQLDCVVCMVLTAIFFFKYLKTDMHSNFQLQLHFAIYMQKLLKYD